jgi:hypothetical protein
MTNIFYLYFSYSIPYLIKLYDIIFGKESVAPESSEQKGSMESRKAVLCLTLAVYTVKSEIQK